MRPPIARTTRGLVSRLLALVVAGGILAACGGGSPPAPPSSQGVIQDRVVPGTIPLVDPAGHTTTWTPIGASTSSWPRSSRSARTNARW